MAKNTTEYLQFGITPELKQKVNNFCKIKGNTKNQLFNDLLEEFFKNKIVANDFIKLDKPLYFNVEELINNKFVECTTNEPTHNFNEYYIINLVPNNLDSYNPEHKTFCNGSRLEHKGILINCFNIKNDFKYYYLLFEYVLKDINSILDDKPILKISLIDPTEIIFNSDVVTNKDILTQLQHQENEIKEAIKQHQDINYNLSDKEISKLIKEDQNGTININEYKHQATPNINLLYEIQEDNIKNGRPHYYIDAILLKEWSNYYILRPYTIEHTLKTVLYLCENNPEIKKFVEEPPLFINIEDIRQYLQDYKFNINVVNCYNHLRPRQDGININNLLDMHKNNRTYNEQYTEDQNEFYRKIIIANIENTEQDLINLVGAYNNKKFNEQHTENKKASFKDVRTRNHNQED